tara:strand:- start:186 stop:500 length:315 start_codon:yes stop_codon:yes gene_type:complete
MKAIKILLGIIAVNLTLITLIQLEIFPPKAYANETNTSTTPINTNYGLVPLNENGGIDVNVVSKMDVWLKGWYDPDFKEYYYFGYKIENNRTPYKWAPLPVGGY